MSNQTIFEAAQNSAAQHQRNRPAPDSKLDRVRQAMSWWNGQTPDVRQVMRAHSNLITSTDVTNFYWG
ncbi:hypothetical protein Aura_00044 [Pseudomonas phage vB_PpuM-Aura]